MEKFGSLKKKNEKINKDIYIKRIENFIKEPNFFEINGNKIKNPIYGLAKMLNLGIDENFNGYGNNEKILSKDVVTSLGKSQSNLNLVFKENHNIVIIDPTIDNKDESIIGTIFAKKFYDQTTGVERLNFKFIREKNGQKMFCDVKPKFKKDEEKKYIYIEMENGEKKRIIERYVILFYDKQEKKNKIIGSISIKGKKEDGSIKILNFLE